MTTTTKGKAARAKERKQTVRREVKTEIVERLASLTKEEEKEVFELASMLDAANEDDRMEIATAIVEIIFAPRTTKTTSSAELRKRLPSAARLRVVQYRQRVGERIRDRRRELRLTQEHLARLAGIPQSHLSRLERGRHAAAHRTIERIAKGLKVTPSELDPGYSEE